MKCVPKVNRNYWFVICLASIFGANTGDYLADALGLGHLKGIPVLAALFAIILIAERMSKVTSALFYWAGIITVRAAATNIGDIFHDHKIGFGTSIPLMLVVLLISVTVWKMARGTDTTGSSTIPVNSYYWVTMFLAGILGTVVGDFCSFATGLGPLRAALVQGSVLLAMLLVGNASGIQTELYYFWLSIGVVRAAGTSAGDFFAHTLGLGTSEACSGAVFIAMILLFYGTSQKHVVLKGQTATG